MEPVLLGLDDLRNDHLIKSYLSELVDRYELSSIEFAIDRTAVTLNNVAIKKKRPSKKQVRAIKAELADVLQTQFQKLPPAAYVEFNWWGISPAHIITFYGAMTRH